MALEQKLVLSVPEILAASKVASQLCDVAFLWKCLLEEWTLFPKDIPSFVVWEMVVESIVWHNGSNGLKCADRKANSKSSSLMCLHKLCVHLKSGSDLCTFRCFFCQKSFCVSGEFFFCNLCHLSCVFSMPRQSIGGAVSMRSGEDKGQSSHQDLQGTEGSVLRLCSGLRQVLEHGELAYSRFLMTDAICWIWNDAQLTCSHEFDVICFYFSLPGNGRRRWDVQRASAGRGLLPWESSHHFTGRHYFLLCIWLKCVFYLAIPKVTICKISVLVYLATL